eukprot:2821707-Prymnesium_polylepis.1
MASARRQGAAWAHLLSTCMYPSRVARETRAKALPFVRTCACASAMQPHTSAQRPSAASERRS